MGRASARDDGDRQTGNAVAPERTPEGEQDSPYRTGNASSLSLSPDSVESDPLPVAPPLDEDEDDDSVLEGETLASVNSEPVLPITTSPKPVRPVVPGIDGFHREAATAQGCGVCIVM